ncbi:MAG: YihY/virulence factor BrkB family protein [Ignavibacteria bacterium]|nr:YihY/virulence factor BrkB family protein [Ignavibacteria bacterium]
MPLLKTKSVEVLTTLKIKLPKFIVSAFRFLVDFFDRIGNHHIFLLSAAITFNAILYIVPLILVVIFITYLFLNKSEFIEIIPILLLSFLPETEETYYFLSNLLIEINKIFSLSSYLGLAGIITLLWLSSTLLSSLRSSLNVVFEAKAQKVFIIYRLKDMFLTLVLTIFILLLVYLLPFSNLIYKTMSNILPVEFIQILSKLTSQFVWIPLYFCFFLFIYKFIPNKKIPWKVILFSSSLSTILVEVARLLFTFYIKNIVDYSRFYGAYGFLVAILIWLYYLFFIVLFSAEFVQFVFAKRIQGNYDSSQIQADE